MSESIPCLFGLVGAACEAGFSWEFADLRATITQAPDSRWTWRLYGFGRLGESEWLGGSAESVEDACTALEDEWEGTVSAFRSFISAQADEWFAGNGARPDRWFEP